MVGFLPLWPWDGHGATCVGTTTKPCVPSLRQTPLVLQVPAALAVTIRAVVVLHPTDAETEAQSADPTARSPPGHTGREPWLI